MRLFPAFVNNSEAFKDYNVVQKTAKKGIRKEGGTIKERQVLKMEGTLPPFLALAKSLLIGVYLVSTYWGWFDWLVPLQAYKILSCFSPLLCSLFFTKL